VQHAIFCTVPTLHVFCVALIAIITKSSLLFLCHIFATMLTILATLFFWAANKHKATLLMTMK
jgi:hypothetical protein